MKKGRFFFSTLLLVSISYLLSSQNSFFEKGAIWLSSYESECGIGYEVTEYIKDTLADQKYFILESSRIYFEFSSDKIVRKKIRRHYFTFEGTVLYKATSLDKFKDKIEDYVFDIGAKQNDTLIIRKRPFPFSNIDWEIPFLIIVIDSIGYKDFNKQKLKTWYCNLMERSPSNLKFYNKAKVEFLDNIGLMNPSLIYLWHLAIVNYLDGSFLAHKNNSGFFYDPENRFDDFLKLRNLLDKKEDSQFIPLSSEEFEILIYPNPASQYININIDDKINLNDLKIEVFGTDCSLVAVMNPGSYNSTIDLSNFIPGNYFVLIKRQEKIIETKKFIKVN